MKKSLLALLVFSSLMCKTNAPQVPQLGKSTVKEVIAAMTLEEKAKMVVGMGMTVPGAPAGFLPPTDSADAKIPQKVAGTSGRTHPIPRLGIPSIVMADGPAGVHFLDFTNVKNDKTNATAIPIGTLLASTWDTVLVRQTTNVLGSEARDLGCDIVLGPAQNIHRNPLSGRNFEYYSEDPILSGNIAAAAIQGIQDKDMGTSLKHFAANNSENNRTLLNTFVSERALREVYLRNFEIAVKKAHPWTLMSSYNLINGVYTSESTDLLTTVLRKEWGFDGLVMSDWFALKDPVKQIAAGNDLLMPGRPDQVQAIIEGVKKGDLAIEKLDLSVERVLNLILRTSTFKDYKYSNNPDLKANAETSRKAATEGIVLLKNNGVLPLSNGAKMVLLGDASYDLIAGGTGSGDVKKAYTVSLFEGLTNAGFKVDEKVSSVYQDYIKAEKAKFPPPSMMSLFNPPTVKEMPLDKAVYTPSVNSADVVILSIGRLAGEGQDRKVENDFALTDAEKATIKNVSDLCHAQNKKVVVVINAGGVIETASWRDKVDGILLAWLPGMEGGNAVADILSGKINPSGKLPSTFPMAYADVPSAKNFPGKLLPGEYKGPIDPIFNAKPAEIHYDEGIYVGYRGYDKQNIVPAYEFGYGLSYTDFAYSDLKLSRPDFTDKITVSVTVKNTGKVAGKEVAQLYLSAPNKILDKPMQELKGFGKTKLLQPNESQTLTFDLTAKDLASFDEKSSMWVAEMGNYTVKIGASSRNIKLKADFKLDKTLEVEQVNKVFQMK